VSRAGLGRSAVILGGPSTEARELRVWRNAKSRRSATRARFAPRGQPSQVASGRLENLRRRSALSSALKGRFGRIGNVELNARCNSSGTMRSI
jgi:hypothetical protein